SDVIDQPGHVRRRRRGNLSCQSVVRTAGVGLGHNHVKRTAYLVVAAPNIPNESDASQAVSPRERSGAQVQADIVGAGIGQGTEPVRSYRRVVLEYQADGRLDRHRDRELRGAGRPLAYSRDRPQAAARHEQTSPHRDPVIHAHLQSACFKGSLGTCWHNLSWLPTDIGRIRSAIVLKGVHAHNGTYVIAIESKGLYAAGDRPGDTPVNKGGVAEPK